MQPGVPNGMFFTDKNTGYKTGVNLFIKTTDGGNTWMSSILLICSNLNLIASMGLGFGTFFPTESLHRPIGYRQAGLGVLYQANAWFTPRAKLCSETRL